MNSKPTLLISQDKTIFSNWFMEDHLAEYFNVEVLDTAKCYDVKSTVVVVDYHEFVSSNAHDELALRDRGLRLIIDKCWDCWAGHLDFAADYTLRPRDFIRWHESIWYTALGYNKPIVHNPTRDFLLLMHMRTAWRNDIYRKFYDILDDNIYSYVGNGIPLQNAVDVGYDEKWQRHIDPDWYTDTRFSLVSESTVKDISVNDRSRNWIHVSEKIYKPLACKHPFVVVGVDKTLEYLKRFGYKTFDKWIDESYDQEQDVRFRWYAIMEIARKIANTSLEDLHKEHTEMTSVILHNQTWFKRNKKQELEQAQTNEANKKASGKQKLKDLGLDDEEIKALIGA